MIRVLDEMNSNPDMIEPLRLKVMDVTIRAFKMCYSMVRDVDVEMLEDELERIKSARDGQEFIDFAPLEFEKGEVQP
jgi:hypothetical protein